MAEKSVRRAATREGKIYQLKKSAGRAAREDGLKDSEFSLRQSARKEGWYYMKIAPKSDNERDIASEVLDEHDDTELAEIKENVPVAVMTETTPSAVIVERPEVQEKLATVMTKAEDVNSPRTAEQVRTVVQNAEPPPLPSEKKVAEKVVVKVERLHKSTVEGPTKLVWFIAEELHAANPSIKRSQVIAECVKRGIAFFTARTQYQQWMTATRESSKNSQIANTQKK